MFRVIDVAAGANRSELIFPGYPGLVVTQAELRQMSWGFPRAQVSKKTGKPIKPKAVTNARNDRLHIAFWRDSFVRRRCLIPANSFAEAEGKAGRTTRTWISVPAEEVFAIAGIWQQSHEWGPTYSMVTCQPTSQTAAIHDRMPVILKEADCERWLRGSPEEALALCTPYSGPLAIERTSVPWNFRH